MPCSQKQKVTWLDKAKFIKDYAVDSCSTTLKVYVETGIVADQNLVMGIVNTSPTDFVRFLLRPKGARTMRHGIRSLKTNEAASEDELIPDTAKLAADTIHEITGWHLPSWGELGDALFDVAKPFFRGAYYLIIANVTEDFAFDWYSGILLSPDSKCDLGRFSVTAFAGTQQSTPFTACAPATNIITPKDAKIDGVGMTLGEGTWVIIFTLHAQQLVFPTGSGKCNFRMIVGLLNPQPCGATVSVDVPAGGESKVAKFVRKVVGPEWVGLQGSWHSDEPGIFISDFGGVFEGFRI